jgi:hypothetical protein
MADIERLLGDRMRTHDRRRCASRVPGDMGWVVQSHGAFYAREYGFDSSFEGLVAEITAKFLASFDASRERCWIAEIEGSAGRLDLSGAAHRRRRQAAPAAGRAGRARPGAWAIGWSANASRSRKACGYRRITLWTQSIPGRRPQNLSGSRVQAGRHRAASQLRAKPDRRNLGTGTVKPRVATTSRRVTPDLLDFYIKRAHALARSMLANVWRAIGALLVRLTRLVL